MITREDLKEVFPWLGTNAEADGGDVVERLTDLYESLPAQTETPVPPVASERNTMALPSELDNRLFIGIRSEGISYADRWVEVNGDYKDIAFLRFGDLGLRFYVGPDHDLIQEVRAHAQSITVRRGEKFEVSSCGQTVTLGSELDEG